MFIYTIHNKITIITIVLMIFSPISLASNNFTIIYLSDVKLDLSGGTQTIHTIKSQARNGFIEEFNSPPYAEIATWCSQNGWFYSGNHPCWWGVLWLGVTSNGKLRWHNWPHSIGGAIYNFSMWKDFNSLGSEWELYIPMNSWRVSGGVAGAPSLYIYIELYDKFGFRLFRAVLTYDGIQRFNSIIAEIYG
ncbi:MAG: hypothetical protein RMI53_06890, partial [Nitrososphaerota archaeon]|nr:hypothetical protein [Nitrososphaerota archaeon]